MTQGKQDQQKPLSSACQLALDTHSDNSLLDELGTGLSGLDASGHALSALATQAPKDLSAAAPYLGESASRFASPLGTGIGVVKAGSNFLQGDISGGVYSSVDVGSLRGCRSGSYCCDTCVIYDNVAANKRNSADKKQAGDAMRHCSAFSG